AVSALFPAQPSVGTVTTRDNKPFVLGKQLDFDSVAQGDLNQFPYVITSSSQYSSQPPPNYHLVRSGRLYDLWQRTGYTSPRQVIEPPGAPGGVLDCRSALGRRLRASRGEASITASPITLAGPNFVPGGGSVAVPLRLPVGRWEISVQYISSFDFDL